MKISREEMRKVFGGRDTMIWGKPAPMYCLDIPLDDGAIWTQCERETSQGGSSGNGTSNGSSSGSSRESGSGSSGSQGSTAVAGVRG